MNILLIRTSNRALSISNKLADKVLHTCQETAQTVPNVQILNVYDLPHIDKDYAESLRSRHDNDDANSASLILSDALIQQLISADVVIIATPMHNFTVPSCLKAWIDHVVRIGKTFTATPEGKIGTLIDRPVYIAVSAGGLLDGRQPDFLQNYLQTVFETIGINSLKFFVIQGSVMGENHLEQEWLSIKQKIDAHFHQNKPL